MAKTTTPTEEKKKEQIERFLGQKREQFATGILFNLCRSAETYSKEVTDALVDASVEMADRLMERLYTIPKE